MADRVVIGIDLGTTNSVVAIVEGGTPQVIASAEGPRTVPSVIAYSKKGEVTVGQVARNSAAVNPDTFASIKRLMGRQYEELTAEDLRQIPYKVEADEKGRAVVRVGDKTLLPEQISAEVLKKLKADAEAYLGREVSGAVITVPAYFNDAQRAATKNAGALAGLEVERIINEPTAAAMAFGLDLKAGKKVLVFDLGGGTFDVSVLEIEDNFFEVKSTDGDTHLGGDDYDRVVVDWIASKVKADQGVDLRTHGTAAEQKTVLVRLLEAAEKAKMELSAKTATKVTLPYAAMKDGAPINIDYELTREKFQEITNALTERCRKPVEKALKEASITAADLDEVILVGGSTRMPAVQKLIKEMTGKDPFKGVNPDEAVAEGAAIQGAALAGQLKGVLLVDVTPLSLGVEVAGGMFDKLIPANTTIPYSTTQVYTTNMDNQPNVQIRVFQGERPLVAQNKFLGEFSLEVAPARAGVPQIKVTFEIDANGIVKVSAMDALEQKPQAITIESSSLSEDEVQQMLKDAKEHEGEDNIKAAAAEARVGSKVLIEQSEKNLNKYRDEISAGLATEIETKVEALRTAAQTGDDPTVTKAFDELKTTVQKIGDELYAKGTSQTSATTEGAGEATSEAEAETPSKKKGKAKESKTAPEAPVDAEIVDAEVVEPASSGIGL